MARDYAISKAMELQETLGSGHPSFVKSMKHAHVSAPFWLGLPAQFCRKHLPKRDERITLVDEEEAETDARYFALHMGVAAGWIRFSLDHGLVVGDCLVFQLVAPTKLKVYIIRQNAYYQNNA